MRRYRLTLKAVRELEEAFDFVAAQSPSAGKKVLEHLFAGMDRVAKTPSLGHYRQDITDRPIKFHLVYSYFIVYDDTTRPIQILHVIHGRRDLKVILQLD